MVQRLNNVSHLFTKLNRMGPEVLIDMGIRGKMNELKSGGASLRMGKNGISRTPRSHAAGPFRRRLLRAPARDPRGGEDGRNAVRGGSAA